MVGKTNLRSTLSTIKEKLSLPGTWELTYQRWRQQRKAWPKHAMSVVILLVVTYFGEWKRNTYAMSRWKRHPSGSVMGHLRYTYTYLTVWQPALDKTDRRLNHIHFCVGGLASHF